MQVWRRAEAGQHDTGHDRNLLPRRGGEDGRWRLGEREGERERLLAELEELRERLCDLDFFRCFLCFLSFFSALRESRSRSRDRECDRDSSRARGSPSSRMPFSRWRSR